MFRDRLLSNSTALGTRVSAKPNELDTRPIRAWMRLLMASADISMTKSQRQDKVDLAALVRPIPDDQSGIYSHALQLLSAMQGSPSCNRVAASTLLDSCHSIDGSRQDAEISFEDARSIYAAQLAMCEIASAESSIPHSCQALVPVLGSKVHKISPQESIRKGQLSQCLQTLESRPQWWTSYSNSRQNAVIMCQAARVDIEKGMC